MIELVPHQPEAGRVGVGQVGEHQRLAWRFGGHQAALFTNQLAPVEAPVRVDALLVVGKGGQFFVRKKLQLGDADAMLARDHAVQAAGELHDAAHRLVRGLQHFVIVAVHRDVGVDVAVARVHVQRHPHAAFQHALVDFVEFGQHGLEGLAAEDLRHRCLELGFPAGPQAMLLQVREQRGDVGQPVGPLGTHFMHQRLGLMDTVFQQLGGRDAVFALAQRQLALGEKLQQRIAQRQLVAQGQLDVDALDAVGVFGHARQGNHHVLVDLEGVGVLGNGGGALAIQPEFFACLAADGDKAFAAARVGDAHHFAGDAGHLVGIVAHDVAHQHHLGQLAVALLALGGVAHGFQVAVVQVFQARQQHAAALLLLEHVVLDLDDAGHGQLGAAEKLQAHGARMRGHAVHDPAGAGDQPVRALFLHAGQAAEELVRHVLAQPFLAELVAGDVQALGTQGRLAVGLEVGQLETGYLGIVNLAQVVVHAGNFQPQPVGRDHAPGSQVVQCRAPQHGLFAAGVHGDVAADARGLDRRGIDGKDKARRLGCLGHALGDHARFRPHGGHGFVQTGQLHHLHGGDGVQLLGVDDHAAPGQRNRPAGVTGAAPTGDDSQLQLDAALHQGGHFHLGIGRQDDEGVFHAPVGGVGHVADARHAVELDVVLVRQLAQRLAHLLAQLAGLGEHALELLHRPLGRLHQLAHQGVTLGIFLRLAALLHLGQPVAHGLHQLAAPLAAVQQIVLQIGVALHHPDVAQHLVQHAGRTARAPLRAQPLQHLPGTVPQQANDDLFVGKRGVVVRNFAQAGRLCCGGQHSGLCNRCIHGGGAG